MLCQQTSPKRWFANVIVTSYCDVTNIVYPVTMTTMGLRHCSILEFGRGASNQPVAPGITRPLHATGSRVRSQIRGRQKVFTCSNTPASLWQQLVSHKSDYLFWAKKMVIFVGRTMRSFREAPQFKTAFYHSFTKSLKRVQKDRPSFTRYATENVMRVANNLLYLH